MDHYSEDLLRTRHCYLKKIVKEEGNILQKQGEIKSKLGSEKGNIRD